MNQPQVSQSWYHNTPYPPILPSIQYSQIPPPTSSQFNAESDSPTPSPTQCSPLKSEEELLQSFTAPDPNYYATLRSFENQSLSPHPHPTPYHLSIPVLDDPTPRLSKSLRTDKSTAAPSKKIHIAHPYARIFAKKDEVKRRKIWNHVLEKSIFTPYELNAASITRSTLGAPQRRAIYISSLEAHVDRLHDSLLALNFWPVRFEDLEPFKGLNSKTAKSMVAGLQYDASIWKLKLLELERANEDLSKVHSKMASEI